MDFVKIPFPGPPDDCRDPELCKLLAQFEFVRWMRDEHTQEYDRIRNTLVSDIDRVVAAIDEPDPVFRLRAAIFSIAFYREHRIDLILRILDDADAYVRSQIASHLISVSHPQVQGRLVELLLTDPAPEVRGSACRGLAGQNPLSAIPVLIRAMDADHAVDDNGHVVSNQAADALDEMMGTEFMAKRDDGVCTFPNGPADPQSVRQHAIAFLEKLQLEDRK